MNNKEFVNALIVAHDVPNCYSNNYPKNLGYYDGSKYSFDCWNLIKVVLSGWKPTGIKGDYVKTKDLVTGDVDGITLLNRCTNRSQDFSKLMIPGTYLYLASDPHSGIYIGERVVDGKVYNVIEATKNGKFGNGVVYTYVDKDGTRRKYKGSSATSLKWTEYGMLTKYVEYLEMPLETTPAKEDYSKLPVLKKGSKGTYVKDLKVMLIKKGYMPFNDTFDDACLDAVKKFQSDNKDVEGKQLVVDGYVGPKTWGALYK